MINSTEISTPKFDVKFDKMNSFQRVFKAFYRAKFVQEYL